MTTSHDQPNAQAFLADLEAVINKHGMENSSNTADFILAQYLVHCLEAFDYATRYRAASNTHPGDPNDFARHDQPEVAHYDAHPEALSQRLATPAHPWLTPEATTRMRDSRR
jgi:hypothetical protein